MSRTEGIFLPRLPPSHMRVGTLPVTAQSYSWLREQTRGLETDPLGFVIPPEPAHKGFLGSPRYDLPPHVYTDPVMYEEVFVKEVPLIRKIPDLSAERPLEYNSYDSLHDPHCRAFLLGSRVFRRHLERQGLVTSDMRVVAAPCEQRQRVRAHELLERREMLVEKLRERNEDRKLRLRQIPPKLPKILKWTVDRSEAREKQREFNLSKLKSEKRIKEIEDKKASQDSAMREANRLKALLEDLGIEREKQRIENERKFNRRMKQEYERRFADKKRGKDIASWRMESDRIHNRIIHMTLLKWNDRTQIPSTFQRDTNISSYFSGDLYQGLMVQSPISEKRESQLSKDESAAQVNKEEIIERIISDISVEVDTPSVEERIDISTEDVVIKSPAISDRDYEVIEIVYTPTEQTDIEPDNRGETTDDDRAHRLSTDARLYEDTASDLERPSETDALSGEEERSQVDMYHLSPIEKFYYIMNESLRAVDPNETGTVVLEGLLQVLRQPNLGLYLTDEELHFIGAQFGTNRFQTVNYNTILPALPQLLASIYHQRSQQQLINYSYSFEEVWCQLFHPSTGYIYFNKFSKQMTDTRPEDFRPSLREDLFEEVIIEMIFLTDTRKDGVIDQDEFNNFLSLQTSTPLTPNQLIDLRDNFTTLSTVTADGVFYIHYGEFVSIAHQLIMYLYQNMVPGKSVWVELPSTKVKSFWFNKQTGETSLTAPKREDISTPEKRTSMGSRLQPLPAIEEVPSRTSSTLPPPLVSDVVIPTPPSLKRRETPRHTSKQSLREREVAEVDDSKTELRTDSDIEVRLASKLSSLSTNSQPIRVEPNYHTENLGGIDRQSVSLATQIV